MTWPALLLRILGVLIVAPLGIYLWISPSDKVITDVRKLWDWTSSPFRKKAGE